MTGTIIAEIKVITATLFLFFSNKEEVASTRSLLNTARLMDENATLYRLNELEYIERICEKIGSISLNGNGDLLSQLTTYLTGSKVDKK